MKNVFFFLFSIIYINSAFPGPVSFPEKITELRKPLTCSTTAASFRKYTDHKIKIKSLTADTNVIDVGLFYNPQALAAVGGIRSATAEAQQLVDQTNSIFASSGIQARLALVHVGGSQLADNSDQLISLYSIQNPADGIADDINSIRNQKGIDVVFLVQEAYNQTACGRAFQTTDNLQNFADFGFAVIARYCLPTYVFAHELGHILGANHDQQAAASQGAFPYSSGYVFPNSNGQLLQTVMSIQNLSKVPYFSNPQKTFQGLALGNQESNNSLAINNTYKNIAAYMPAKSKTLNRAKVSKIRYSRIVSARRKENKCKVTVELLDKNLKPVTGAAVSVNRQSDLVGISPVRFTSKIGRASISFAYTEPVSVYAWYLQSNRRSKYFVCS